METKIMLNHYQIKALLELSESSGDPEMFDEMELVIGGENAHSGPGVYACFTECQEEGAIYLGEDEADDERAQAICNAKIESGEVTVN